MVKALLTISLFIVMGFPVADAHHIPKGDLDGDGDVDLADFLLFTDNFGKGKYQQAMMPHTVDTVTVVRVDTLTITRTIEVAPKQPLQSIIVEWSSDWGNTNIDILGKVFASTRDVLSESLLYAYDSPIYVTHDTTGPLALHARNKRGYYQVLIDSENNRWAQQIYQFAHEYGHVLSNYRENMGNRKQLWFEESLAALASIYALKTLSEKWKISAPTRYFKNYAVNGSLDSYWRYLEKETPHINLSNAEFQRWYQESKGQLENSAYLRDKNRVVAFHLLDIFENDPSAWNAIRYLNKGPLSKNRTLQSYLSDWYLRTPPRWQDVPGQILKRFGIERVSKPIIDG